MLESILPYERDLFFLINHTHNYFLDCWMWLYSGYKVWIPLYPLFLISFVFKKDWKQWLPVVLTIAIMFVACDQFSSHLIKPLFSRLRPTHHPDFMNEVRTLYGYKGGMYGFISGHATNAFGFAILSSLLFRYRLYTVIVFIWAFIMAYSRVYLGVHFISDVVVGAFSGIIIGFLVYKMYILFVNNTLTKKNISLMADYSNKRVKRISIIIVCYIILFSSMSELLIGFIK